MSIKTIFLLIFLSSTFAEGQQENTDVIRLKQAINIFYDAIERGDALARVSLLDDDVILMPNGWAMVHGKENVAKVFTTDTAEAVFRLKDRTVVDMAISDSIAYTVNSYYYTYHEKNKEPQWRKTKNIHIWWKDRLGKWKLRVDIWNSDSPIEFKLK